MYLGDMDLMVLIAAKEFMAVPPAQRHMQTEDSADPGEINAHLAGIQELALPQLLETLGFLKIILPFQAIQKTPFRERIVMPDGMKGPGSARGQESADQETKDKVSHMYASF